MVENRKFIRLQSAVSLRCKPVVKKGRFGRPKATHCQVKDIGGGGLRVVVDSEMRIGDLLNLEISIPHLSEAIEAVGEVVWFSKTRSKDHEIREAGLRFRDIRPEDLHRIFEFVYAIGIG